MNCSTLSVIAPYRQMYHRIDSQSQLKKIRLFMDMAYRMCKPLWQNIILSMLWIMQTDGLNLQQICQTLSFHDRKL